MYAAGQGPLAGYGRRTRFAAAGAIVLVMALVLLVSSGTLHVGSRSCGGRLDLSGWQPSRFDNGSQAVAHDIVRCDRLDGLTRTQVRDRLGAPGTQRAGGEWLYATGRTGPGMFSHAQGLVVEFGADGRVRKTSMRR